MKMQRAEKNKKANKAVSAAMPAEGCLWSRRTAGFRSWASCAGLLVFWSFLLPAAAGAQPATVLGEVVPLSDTVAEVQCPAAGRIISPRETPLTVGDQVKAGDPLAIIEHHFVLHDAAHLSNTRWNLLSAMLDARGVSLEARIEREKAERLLGLGSVSGKRVQELRAAELVAKAEYDKRRTLLEQQDSQIQKTELVRRGIFSPIDGDVSFTNFTQGQVINEGTLLFRIVNLKEVGISARFAEADRNRLRPDSTVKVRFDNVPGKVFTGRLEVMPPAINPVTRTWDVLFRVENPGEHLRFGMIGRVELSP